MRNHVESKGLPAPSNIVVPGRSYGGGRGVHCNFTFTPELIVDSSPGSILLILNIHYTDCTVLTAVMEWNHLCLVDFKASFSFCIFFFQGVIFGNFYYIINILSYVVRLERLKILSLIKILFRFCLI